MCHNPLFFCSVKFLTCHTHCMACLCLDDHLISFHVRGTVLLCISDKSVLLTTVYMVILYHLGEVLSGFKEIQGIIRGLLLIT